jgi:mono/diheme cytochrome c family protein
MQNELKSSILVVLRNQIRAVNMPICRAVVLIQIKPETRFQDRIQTHRRRMRSAMLRMSILATVAFGLQSQPSLAADAAQGRQLALRWCASCHAVTAEPSRTADTPPPFANVAQRPDFDASRLAFFLLNPHPVMPNMGLSRSEATDLAAYIASLRK